MKNIKIYIYYYLCTVILNMTFSIGFSILIFLFFKVSIIYGFSFLFMSFGSAISLSFKEYISNSGNENYFYYNFGILKYKFVIFSSIINILFGLILLIGFSYGI